MRGGCSLRSGALEREEVVALLTALKQGVAPTDDEVAYRAQDISVVLVGR